MSDMSIQIDQNEYSEKWMDEIPIDSERAKQMKSKATDQEISQLRGALGTLAWRSSQCSPHYQADVGLLLSEVPYATVSTLMTVNKLIREVRRTTSASHISQLESALERVSSCCMGRCLQ